MLYLALPVDLRNRYTDSEWLIYPKMVLEKTYTSDDVVVLSEFVVKDRAEMLEAIHQIKQQGGRTIYIGAQANESDEWKRQLVMLGVYDFHFVGDQLVLGNIDDLIENPRSIKDVREYLPATDNQVLIEIPTVVDEFVETTDDVTEQVATSTELAAQDLPETFFEKVKDNWKQRRSSRQGESIEPTIPRPTMRAKQAGKKTVVVWKNPDPINVCLLGDSGAGKTFVAWNIAALCDKKSLPSAVVESDNQTLMHWNDPVNGVHVTGTIPGKGYRVHVVTDPGKLKDADLFVVVTFPDAHRIERLKLMLAQRRIPKEQTMWVVNNHLAELPLPVGIDEPVVVVHHDPRQVGAVRMKTPLVLSDNAFAQLFEPIVNRISDLFIEKAEGGKQHVAGSGV